MDQFADNYISENAALRRKLQSKAEAVLILSKELEQCRIERDQFKMMAEQVQDRYTKLKKMSPDLQSFDGGSGSRLCQVFDDLKEQNKILKLEVEDLKQKLKDAHGDMKALRAGLNQQRGGGDNSTIPSHQREELVQQLEGMGSRCTQLQSDMQALLDEKEELVMERDAYKCKVHRMNHQLCVLLRAKPSPLFDIDALVTENKYLHERLDQLKEESELAHQALVKYKSMLDKKRNKGSVRLGTNNNTNAAGMVVSHKQVQQLLECGSPSQLPNTEATLADLRSLCLALLEALQDKSLALSHQKKSNKILANRVYDLEQRLANVQDGTPVYPSQILLHDYSGSNVDKDLQLQKVHNIVSEDCTEDNNLNDTDKLCEDSSCMRLTSLSSSVDNGSDTITVVIDDSSDNSSKLYQNSAITSSNRSENTVLTSESEDLTVDVLPPQLQELVLNALQDIENNTRNGMIHS